MFFEMLKVFIYEEKQSCYNVAIPCMAPAFSLSA